MQASVFAWYNPCRKHEAIRGQTPAMAAGITGKVRAIYNLRSLAPNHS